MSPDVGGWNALSTEAQGAHHRPYQAPTSNWTIPSADVGANALTTITEDGKEFQICATTAFSRANGRSAPISSAGRPPLRADARKHVHQPPAGNYDRLLDFSRA
jgi:hypothetical protein